MQMTTLKAHRYGGKQNRPGDLIEVRSSDVRLVRAMGWAKDAPTSDPDAPAVPARHDLATVTAAKPKRAYRRRDMTAEA